VAVGTVDRVDGVASELTSAPARPISCFAPFLDATDCIADSPTLERLANANGYLFLRNVAPIDTVNVLRAQVLDVLARRGWLDDDAPRSHAVSHADAARRATRDELLALQGDVQILPAFSELRRDQRILSVLAAVFGAPPVAGYGDVCRLAFPHDLERTTRPHQDYFYTRKSTALWTVWIPLGDCPSTLGGLAVLPGSHVGGLRAHDGGEGEARFIVLPEETLWAGNDFAAGDVLFFNALTVHGARPNVSANGIRISADFRFQPAPSHA
jgi:ectoine hydroxylase-related dioxygenase (phytanoyl-CoA dioxygenase family)